MKQEVINGFINRFKENPTHNIRCGGRFEILGNHTDHNHGECIAATCSMSIFSCIKIESNNNIIVTSDKYSESNINITSLEKNEKEIGTSDALIRGVAFYLKEHGYKVGGFIAYTVSTIFPGAGVSSSAAYELLIGQIFNELYNNNQIDRITLAKAGQFAENVYYGKKCGLLDQIGVSTGGMVHIDFNNPELPIIEPLHMDLSGYSFILVNTGGDHSKMSGLYSKIPEDMKLVSKFLNVSFLRDSSLENLNKIKDKLDADLYLRAKHFYTENERVKIAVRAIENNDIKTLIKCINDSRKSSANDLKNMVATTYEGSPLEACDLVDKLTHFEGAAKINGGGFAGSIVTLIPDKYKTEFTIKIKEKYGADSIYLVDIDQIGVGEY